MANILLNVQEIDGGGHSQSSLAFARIRGDILAGREAPGKRLKITDLAESISVSPGAIREALSRLTSEQLVVSQDQRGFFVAPLSMEDLQDLTNLRCEIEVIALRLSVRHGDIDWEVGILTAAHRLKNTLQLLDPEQPSLSLEWVERHAALHTALVAACGSRRLLALHASLYEQSERYRGLSVGVEGARDVVAEHQALVDAALARDVDQLVELTIGHIRQTTALIIRRTQGATIDHKEYLPSARKRSKPLKK